MPPSNARARLLEAPILPTLVRLAAPTLALTAVQLVAVVVEWAFIGRLGTEAIAGVALVVPLIMLMQMMSAGAMGGGISSAVARALGANRRDDAESIAWHAFLIACALGIVFTAIAIGLGRPLYALLGGEGAVLAAALAYSDVFFAGAIFICLMNGLASMLRGTGDMRTPAVVLVAASLGAIALMPILMFGWAGLPALGVRGAALATLVTSAAGCAVLARRVFGADAAMHLRRHAMRGAHFAEILKVGIPACIHATLINVTVAAVTRFVAAFGPAALAGYGIGARLEYLQVPIAFGFGAALVAMVGTNVGAGQHDRARRIAWTGGLFGGAVSGSIGLVAALAPWLWAGMFSSDPEVLAAAATYFRIVGPAYVCIGFGMALYFAFQGTGRMHMPLACVGTRLALVLAGCFAVEAAGGFGPAAFFAVVTGSLLAFGAMYALGTGRFFAR